MESIAHLLTNKDGFPIIFINRQTAIDRAREKIKEAIANIDKEEENLQKEIAEWKAAHPETN